jgi:hypothetical protein
MIRGQQNIKLIILILFKLWSKCSWFRPYVARCHFVDYTVSMSRDWEGGTGIMMIAENPDTYSKTYPRATPRSITPHDLTSDRKKILSDETPATNILSYGLIKWQPLLATSAASFSNSCTKVVWWRSYVISTEVNHLNGLRQGHPYLNVSKNETLPVKGLFSKQHNSLCWCEVVNVRMKSPL